MAGELASLTSAHLPGLNYNPEPIIQAQQFGVPNTTEASGILGKAAVMNAAADTINALPSDINTAYQTGQANVIQSKENQAKLAGLNLKSQVLSGQPMSPQQRQALAGLQIGPDGSTEYTVPQPLDLALKGAQLKNENANANYRNAMAAMYSPNGGNDVWHSYHDQYSAANPGAVYQTDPNAPGAVIAKGSTFGGVADVVSGQDNGLFASGGASVLHKDGTPITAADIPDVKANPQNYMDNPEKYAAFPASVFASGAVKPGDPVNVASTDANGNKTWATVIARDHGPGAGTGRGIDLSQSAMKSLNATTDQPLEVYLPNGQAIASKLGSAPQDITADDGSTIHQEANGAYRVTQQDGTTRIISQGMMRGKPIITTVATKNPNMIASKADLGDAQQLGIDTTGKTPAQVGQAITDAEQQQGVIRPSRMAMAENFASKIATHPILKDLPKVQEAKAAIDAGLANPNAGGYTDMALIEGFQRLVNPGATVRQATMTNMQDAQGWLQQLDPTYQWSHAVEGDKLTPQARQRIGVLANQIYDRTMAEAKPQVDAFKKAAKSYGINNPDTFVNNAFALTPALGTLPAAPAAPASGTPGAAPAPTQQGNRPVIHTQADYDALAPGTPYVDSQGNPGTKKAPAAVAGGVQG